MEAHDPDADAIRQRMAELRRDLSCNVEQVSRNVQEVKRQARTMTDWRYYVKKYPWAIAAVAVGAGFLLVPRRKQVIKPDAATIAEMVKNKQIRVETTASKKEQSMMRSLAMMGITWAARAGAQYITEQMRAAAMQKMHEAQEKNGSPRADAEPSQPTDDIHAKQPR